MQMITELEVVPHETVPGRKIQCHEFSVNNFRVHTCLVQLSRILLASMENQTNNMKGEVVPRDVAALRVGWEAFKSTWQFALDHNNPPSGSYEPGYKIALPTGSELQRVPNIKVRMWSLEVNHLCEIIMSSDSANAAANIAPGSQNDIDTQIQICEDNLSLWLGTGADNQNVGQAVPVFKHLGTVVPDPSLSFSEIREPSASAPTAGRPDVADTPATTGD